MSLTVGKCEIPAVEVNTECHSEEVQRPKNLKMITDFYEILHCIQDDITSIWIYKQKLIKDIYKILHCVQDDIIGFCINPLDSF
ncbi:MAG TPA: hypothetical protein DEP28_00405 [Bacteroidetes bacterium]|nr:hypothetical protein [Bacteroidota bacterium]